MPWYIHFLSLVNTASLSLAYQKLARLPRSYPLGSFVSSPCRDLPAAPQLEKTMMGVTVTKDTVKRDLERAAVSQRSALRVVAALSEV
jgi:hypothetical protein